MKVVIEFYCDNASFDPNTFEAEMRFVLGKAHAKIMQQLDRRTAGVVCDSPESADTLKDVNGNTIGRVALVR